MYIKQHTKNTKEFIPNNPEKYCGRYPILVRSTWERLFFQLCDMTTTIVKWSSESIKIPYWDPVQQRNRVYYPDAYIKVLNNNDGYSEYLIEIKPENETKPPVKKGRMTEKTFRYKQLAYLTNEAKFNAAKEFCRRMKWGFQIMTEKELFTEHRHKRK